MTTRLRTALAASMLAIGTASALPAQDVRNDLWIAGGDTALARLITEALGSNHDVRAADARVRGARAARLHSALDLAPAVIATGGYTGQRMASPMVPGAIDALPDQDLWDAGLRMSWDVDVFGRGRRSLEGYGELVAASREDVRDVQVRLTAEVAAAYYDLRGAQDRLAVAQRNAENQRGTLEITLQRLEGGSGNALDSERARAQLSTTLAAIPLLESAVAEAQYRLAVLTTRERESIAAELSAPASRFTLPNVRVSSADSAVRRRADVRSADRHVAASEAFVGAARAEYLPRISLAGAAGYTGTTLGSLGDGGTPRYAFGPVISWPALDVGRVRAGVDAARAAEAEAEARYAQTFLRARGEIETALVTYRGARERLGHLEAAAEASERAAELARLRYTEGASDFLQVLDAERTLLEAQDRLAMGRSNATAALVAVYRALGGGRPMPAASQR
jgi:outer membrane protein, multidrug efflux system